MADVGPDMTRQISTPAEKAKGIIEDAFRRADKNDDGSLSLEEFQAYFSDDIMSRSQLKELFLLIDTHKTDNIDISELCDYFSKFWGPFESLFAAIDDLNHSVTDCVHKTAQDYNSKGFFEQFGTRYLMKEALNHVHAVEGPLEHVIDSLEKEALKEWSDDSISDSDPVAAVQKRSTPRWQVKLEKKRQTDRSECSTANLLNNEIMKLAKLVDRLDTKVNFSVVEEEEIISSDDSLMLLVSYNVVADDNDLHTVEGYIKQYIDSIKRLNGCYHVMLRKYVGRNKFMIYEIWADTETFQSHNDSVARTTFMTSCSKYIKEFNKFEVPDSWLPND